MRSTIVRLALFAAVVSLLFGVACDKADGNQVLGGSVLGGVQEGINLAADPKAIVLDPNDPDAPTDPDTGKLVGKADILALLADAAGDPVPGVELVFTTSAGIMNSEGQPLTTDENGEAVDTLNVSEDDEGEVVVTVTSDDLESVITIPVIIKPLNSPPVADAGEDQTVECPLVTLDGSGSTDDDSTPGTNDDIVAFVWSVGGEVIAEGEVVDVELPPGMHVVTLEVTDSADATGTDDVNITVEDTLAPQVNLRMSPASLWPPNHKMHDVQAVFQIADCDPTPTVELISVTSSEPDNDTGDGSTYGDIEGVEPGTDDRSISLRAERAGPGSGRVYTVVYRVIDNAGNETMATATVTVPHDQGH